MRLSDIFKFDPDQPRDDDGRWVGDGGEAAVAYGSAKVREALLDQQEKLISGYLGKKPKAGRWVPGYEGRVKDYRKGSLHETQEQTEWMEQQARDHGYQDLSAVDPHLLKRLTAKWREYDRERAAKKETMFQNIFKDLGSPEKIFVGKGLDKDEALALARKKATKDYRGTHYDQETGYVTLT